MVNPPRKQPLGHIASPFPSVENRVEASTELWARDLRSLFDHAKERFGDVSWETDSGGDRIWGHKAVIYARAPKAFKDRYFLTRPFSRSPTLRSPSPSSSHLLPPLFASQPHSPPYSYRNPSSLSVHTAYSDLTLRGQGSDGIMRLTHGDTPEMFQAQLEWLYTGEGFGDVVEWISEEDTGAGTPTTVRDSLGRRGDEYERRDKLGQDLTYMWRSKLYVDVRIHLDRDFSGCEDRGQSSDSDESTDNLSSTAVFTAHRFILVSRSPYFSSLLLNSSSFLSPTLSSNGTTDIHLPTPPFTPASLHFCLGYIYAGHLDFSNRSFDLLTAFQIYRAATYLQLDSLIDEITARIVWDFCHGLDYTLCRCRKCASRIGRVWRFSIEDDVGDIALATAARRYLVSGWGETWGREIGLAPEKHRSQLVQNVKEGIHPRNILPTFKSIGTIKNRIESSIRSKGAAATTWVEGMEKMIEELEDRARGVLVDDFQAIAAGKELWDLLSGKGFSEDLMEGVLKELVDCLGTVKYCVEGPRIYQALVSTILLKSDPETMQPALPIRSRGRQLVESAKEGVVAHIRRRWMQIRDSGGFAGMDIWALKEIADEIEVSDDELVSISTSPSPRRTTPQATRAGIPRTTSKIISLYDTSCRSSIASSSRIPLSPTRREQNGSNVNQTQAPEASGLRRLRLSSSASTNSAISTRSARPRESSPLSAPIPAGPQARSPTAAKPGNRVSIGPSKRTGPARDTSPTPSTRAKRDPISGGIRPLVSRGSLPGKNGVAVGKGKQKDTAGIPEQAGPSSGPKAVPPSQTRSESPRPAPSVSSVRTTKTARSNAAIRSNTTTPKGIPATGIGVKSATPSIASTNTRTPRVSMTKPPVPPVPKVNGNVGASALTTPPAAASSRPAGSTASIATGARARLTSAASTTAASRARTTSASTVASVRTRAPSTTSTMRNPPVPTVPPVPKTKAGSSLASTTPARASGLSPQKTRLGPKAAPRAFPSNASNVVNTLHVPARSASSSTAEDPETRTPRSSETGDSEPIIRLPSDTSESSHYPAPLPARRLPPPVMPRPNRKASSGSTRSTISMRPGHPAAAFDPPRRPSSPVVLEEPQITDGSQPFKGKGVSLRVGIPCIVSLEGRRARFRAQVKYIGYLSNAKGPWVGIEAEDLDRFGIPTLSSGSRDGIHYFHLSRSDPLQTNFEAQAEAENDIRQVRQRKIDLIREGLKRPKLYGLGLGRDSVGGIGFDIGIGTKVGGVRRSTSPFPGGGTGTVGGEWIGKEGLRVLFVRPSEIVYVVGAD